MRNTTLHGALEAFTADAAGRLAMETARGAEIPFEIVENEGRPGRTALYCYRPLTGAFIRERLGLLGALPTYAPASQALAAVEGVDGYLQQRGEARIPADPREQADAALRLFLGHVFAERSEFGFDSERFGIAYDELEHALYDGRCVNTLIAPLLGIGLDANTTELPIGEGLSLVRGETLPDAPMEAVWGAHGTDDARSHEPHVLVALTTTQDRTDRPPVLIARHRFRRVLTALRLFERGSYALGPLAWTRTDRGAWRPVALGTSGRTPLITLIRPAHEDELRAFCNLVARRIPVRGELAWALSRFEMGCERLTPHEALTDYLLALRALLEPEGTGSGRLAQRLAVLCAQPETRADMAERIARAVALERSVMSGLAPVGEATEAIVDELSEHLRALLRDVLCGHLDSDLRAVADELLAEAATTLT